MPTLLMIRPQPLTSEEGMRLPSLCNPVRNGHPVVARADFSLSMSDIVQLAVRMTKAVPDADIVFHEMKPPPTGVVVDKNEYARGSDIRHDYQEDIVDVVDYEEEVIEAESHALAVHDPSSIFDLMDEELELDEQVPPPLIHWWDFVQVGEVDQALSILQEKTLTHDDQVHIRKLMNSDVPEWIVFICYAARLFKWKSMVLTIRKAFHHEDHRVRKAAVTSVAELAGPSMAPAVYPLQTDSHPEVRRAATVAYRKLDR
jgi:hypothetical protein